MGENSFSEQLEEGEIVDDDDFEDISDNSIIETAFGKFVSTSETLRALNLSSDNSDFDKVIQIKCKKKHLQRKSKHRKRKRVKIVTDSSESELEIVADDLKGKLKEAICHNGLAEAKNPLEARLKGMGLSTVENDNAKAENSLDKIDDAELENLRLEALKTAVLNKCQRRKRKKLESEQNAHNKENDTPEEKKEEVDEDVEMLRASLLAGLKMIKEKPANKLPVKIAALPKQNFNVLNKQVVNTKKITVPVPKVKPLIIKVGDSDSDDDIKPEEPPKPTQKVPDLGAISSNVERFLKEQRAKFETESKSVFEKSAVKLLPKSQQLEYQLLLRKLRNAEKRKKQKLALIKQQNSKKAIAVKPSAQMRKTKEDQAIVPRKEEDLKSDISQETKSESSEKTKPKITKELTTLQKTLKEIKTQKNGSLQIKSEYQVLTPIIRKITATSNERKKQEQRIKALLQELNSARNTLAQAHERFSSLVSDLVSRKEQIDQSAQQLQNEPKKTSLPLVTSTPIRQQQSDGNFLDNISFVTSSTNNDCEDMDVCNSDEDCQIDIVDPNDIDQIFKRKLPEKTAAPIPEYISPLNFNMYGNVDPLSIMCPYEVNGSCRDIDCTYKHYLRNGERL